MQHDPTYNLYLAQIQERFNLLTAAPGTKLFTTDTTNLFSVYLSAFPEAERQYHNCNACRRFFERFGGLVLVDDKGVTSSPVWYGTTVPEGYLDPIRAVIQHVLAQPVTGVFYSSDSTWGTPEAGGWTHFGLRVPANLVSPKGNRSVPYPEQRTATHRSDHGDLLRSLALPEFSDEALDKAILMLGADAAYRGEKAKKHAEWLKTAKAARTNSNLFWRVVAFAPEGYCQPRTAMINTVLEDMAKGKSPDHILATFSARTDASVYQRAQAAPTAGALLVAERKFADLGLAPALPRRYADAGDMPFALWRTHTVKESAPPAPGSVFGHIAPRAPAAPVVATAGAAPVTTMTWAKFQRDVLPTALAIEAQVPASSSRFAALVTAVDPSAPNLLAWDNPVSWYYANGVDGEVRRRVVQAGGRYEDVDIRASLIWNNRNDLDLFVTTPRGEQIYYAAKKDRTGGWLDVDMNVSGESDEPVENTRWAKGSAPAGRYEVAVWNYGYHDRGGYGDNPFRLELEVGGRVFTIDGEIPARSKRTQHAVVTFQFGTDGMLVGEPKFAARMSASTGVGNVNAWGATVAEFVPVTAVVPSPNTWGDTPRASAGGEHVFFLLQGCQDSQAGVGRGFFTEQLRSDLYDIRAVLEAYGSTAEIAAAPSGAPACGLGFSTSAPWDLTLRVRNALGTQLVRVDRWE